MKIRSMAARSILAFVMAAALAGCNTSKDLGRMVDWATSDGPDEQAGTAFTREQIAAIPHASVAVRLGQGDRTLLVLDEMQEFKRVWRAKDGFVVTDRGRVVRSSGLGQDLTALSFQRPRYFLEGLHRIETPSEHRLTADFGDLSGYGYVMTCTIRPGRPETIVVLDTALDVTRVEEDCAIDSLDWSFTNVYFADRETGRIWRSRQHFHPEQPPLELELMRPDRWAVAE